ncbi:hypothetical protein [Streptomyces sp. DASNCL29]|uniref:hypothetical protein n=1 Tax=Streptomyces sp. DASNCL29 TaxID=2583819 RepID=UPI00110F8F70|nr:hypothetical protein [Streptomyces sp. DASNCL29]TMU98241.1 hypothetical protein FGK60_10580 [Streptomyces sp. DASNCL29]
MDSPLNTPRSHTSPSTFTGPGETALRTALGNDGYATLRRHRRLTDTALGPLAELLWTTAQEADRLHAELRYYARNTCDHLRHVPAHANQTEAVPLGFLQHTSRAIDVNATRYVQQMNHLNLVIEAYKLALLAA